MWPWPPFQAMEASNGGKSSYINILWLLLRLRQACNHPRHGPVCPIVSVLHQALCTHVLGS